MNGELIVWISSSTNVTKAGKIKVWKVAVRRAETESMTLVTEVLS